MTVSHELLIASHRPADADRHLKAVEDGSIWPAGSGQRLGAWKTVVGPLNRIILLHERDKNPQEKNETVRTQMSTGMSMDKLRPLKLFNPQGDWAQLYELRIYTLKPDAIDNFERLMTRVLPVRERYSPNVGAWRAESGNLARIIHMWAYKDASEREELRPKVNSETVWQEYVTTIIPMIEEMESMFLMPLPFEKNPLSKASAE